MKRFYFSSVNEKYRKKIIQNFSNVSFTVEAAVPPENRAGFSGDGKQLKAGKLLLSPAKGK